MQDVLRYLEYPCRSCLEKLPLSEKIKYAANWADGGRCPKCDHLYCGNPECARLLVSAKTGDYVHPRTSNGKTTVTCEVCKWEHLYLGGVPTHITNPRPPVGS